MKSITNEDRLIKRLLGIFVGGHVLVVTVAMLLLVFYFIRLNGDFYVYVQAFTYWSFTDINPAIPLRGFHIFNDHFDPILIFPALLAKVINPIIVGAFSDYAFILMTSAFFYYLYKKGDLTLSVSAFAIVYTLLACTTIGVLKYPTHPTSWSVLPITLLCWFFHKRQNRAVVFSYLLLLSCKEEFITVGFMVFIAALYRREYRLGLIIGVITFLWTVFVFKLRFILWTYEHISYGRDLMMGFLSNPLAALDSYVPQTLYIHIFLFAPAVLLFWVMVKKKMGWRNIDFSPLFFVLPIYLIRLMPGGWHEDHTTFFSNHYAISMSSFVLMFFIVNLPKFFFSLRFLLIWFVFIAFSNVPAPSILTKGLEMKQTERKTDRSNFREAAIFIDDKPYFEQFKAYEERRKEIVKALVLAENFVKTYPNNNVFGDKVFITHLRDNPYNFRASIWSVYHDPKEFDKQVVVFRNQTWRKQIWDNVGLSNRDATHEIMFLEKSSLYDAGYYPDLEGFFRKNGNVLFEGKYIFLAERSFQK